MTEKEISNAKLFLLFSFLVTFGEVLHLVWENHHLNVGFSFRSERWLLILFLAFIAGIELVLALAKQSKVRRLLIGRWRGVLSALKLKRNCWLAIAGMIVLIAGYSFAVLGSSGDFFKALPERLFLFWYVALFVSLFLSVFNTGFSFWGRLLAGMLGTVVVYRLVLFSQNISTYPFSLGWSETSRYYYASLFFSQKLYGFTIPPSVLHPTRYLMQSVPFLLSNLPLWFHRAWQVFLWLATTFGTAWALKRRLPANRRAGYTGALLVGWVFLFLMQGPVYYHLLVPVILVLVGFDRQRMVRSTLIVLIASAWAGISRLNWYPVPGMIAATLYFLEEPRNGRAIWKYYLLPALWVGSGFVAALAAQAFFLSATGNSAGQYTSSFTSDLLWYRLLPNATFPLGVLTGAALVSAPLWILWSFYWAGGKRRVDIMRWLGIAGILGVLFLGGLVVSVKIGGGSNLHNLDAYLTILLLLGCYVFFDGIAPEHADKHAGENSFRFPAWLIALAFLFPLVFTLNQGSRMVLPARNTTAEVLTELKSLVADAAKDGGDVLFISQRHLLTFGEIPGVKLVPDYENVFLMEMVMSGNRDYLDRFYEDIRNHRYAMIITNPLSVKEKDRSSSFSEENNIWMERISLPVLTVYKPIRVYHKIGIQVLVPDSRP